MHMHARSGVPTRGSHQALPCVGGCCFTILYTWRCADMRAIDPAERSDLANEIRCGLTSRRGRVWSADPPAGVAGLPPAVLFPVDWSLPAQLPACCIV